MSATETCPTCGQPDNCGDCAHYPHCKHCPPECHFVHTVSCRHCEEPRVTLVESFNTVLTAIGEYRERIEAAGVDPTPVVTMLEGFIKALEPEEPPLFDKIWGALPDGSMVARDEVKLILEQVAQDILETPVPFFTKGEFPEHGYALAQTELLRRLRGE